jgi:hypothetical protein
LKKRPVIFLVSVFIIFFLAAGYVRYGLFWNYLYLKQEFQDYLEYKYDMPVIIKDVSFEMFDNEYHGYAYFEDKPKVVFHVGQSGENKEITDAYEYESFGATATSDVKSIANKLLPDNQHARAEIIDMARKEIEVVIWYDNDIKKGTEEMLLTAITKKGYVVKNIYITNDYEK